MPWTTLRTLSAQTGETGAPASFVNVSGLPKNAYISRLVELRVKTPAVGGTASPTNVLVKVWRTIEGEVDYVATWTIATTDITAGEVAPIIVETWGNDLAIKVAFTGGTAPTFTATVQARAVE